MNELLITNSDALAEMCAKVSRSSNIALDTEFSRVHNFFPDLSLVQISNGEFTFCIDMLTNAMSQIKECEERRVKDAIFKKGNCDKMDFSPLYALLQNPLIRKDIHAARQDIEVLHNKFGKNPVNIFDTQIACQFIGFDHPPGYSHMIKFFLNEDVDKSLQFCDWLKRPISTEKLRYALNDVLYLNQAVEQITQELKKLGRIEWVMEECKLLEENTCFVVSVEELLNKFANVLSTKEQFAKTLAVIRWREQMAVQHNLIRRLIISDKEITTFVNSDNFYSKIKKFMTIEARDAIENFKPDDSDSELINRVMSRKNLRSLDKNNRYKELMEILTKTSEQEKICSSLIASSSDILKYVHGIDPMPKFMKGWRYSIFGYRC